MNLKKNNNWLIVSDRLVLNIKTNQRFTIKINDKNHFNSRSRYNYSEKQFQPCHPNW
jgi:hypothetical protein